jgi:hypothetical protein
MRIRILALAGLSLLAAACATVTHRQIGTSLEDDSRATGIRYYNTSPYLLAYSDGKGGIVVSKVLYLPDPQKKMSADLSATLADVGATFVLDRGVMTRSGASGDATAVPKAILQAVETLAPSILGALDEPTSSDDRTFAIPGPYLFKIVVKGGEPYLIGGQAAQPIKITVLPPAGKDN